MNNSCVERSFPNYDELRSQAFGGQRVSQDYVVLGTCKEKKESFFCLGNCARKFFCLEISPVTRSGDIFAREILINIKKSRYTHNLRVWKLWTNSYCVNNYNCESRYISESIITKIDWHHVRMYNEIFNHLTRYSRLSCYPSAWN